MDAHHHVGDLPSTARWGIASWLQAQSFHPPALSHLRTRYLHGRPISVAAAARRLRSATSMRKVRAWPPPKAAMPGKKSIASQEEHLEDRTCRILGVRA